MVHNLSYAYRTCSKGKFGHIQGHYSGLIAGSRNFMWLRSIPKEDLDRKATCHYSPGLLAKFSMMLQRGIVNLARGSLCNPSRALLQDSVVLNAIQTALNVAVACCLALHTWIHSIWQVEAEDSRLEMPICGILPRRKVEALLVVGSVHFCKCRTLVALALPLPKLASSA